MTMSLSPAPSAADRPASRRGVLLVRTLLAALAGAAAALLVSCGSASKALIPSAHAGPLVSDFEAVRNAAENANGDCSATEAAVRKTEEDFGALPATVDAGLRNNLHQGIVNLRVRAHEMCTQPLAQSTATTATTTTEKTTTTTTPTTTTSTETQPTTTAATPTTTTPTTTSPGGGTPAPGAGETPSGGAGSEAGGIGQSGGAGSGAGSDGGGGGAAGGQEGGSGK